ncbi:CobW family GTP-binding protein [Mucilaginibacter sp. KACC 22063]|uniref:CobW family GTP-binding protein n=1 Tax=Mucilaginibacter sp. KACC 22063 TaxID=3025666 RepID=UPI002365608C|nr:GTP-binding protein [Mucilaginibacter sp. KACC 22063]WDF53959.1 GTP-binding protein [Mucilaginibacter sp. KACC 22063]
MSNLQPVPVTIINGFLGAGKTTFLNEVITWKKERRLAIIENEFGETGIDGGLIMDIDNDIFELNNGCLCCSLNEEFYTLLESLWRQREKYYEIVIETTGIADPASVASPFLMDQSISNYFKLKRVICLVDARHVEAELAATEEARKQISFGDILLITKTDLVAPADVERIRRLLSELNPFAEVFMGHKENYPFQEIFDLDRIKIVQRRPKFSLAPPPSTKTHNHHDLTSISFTFTEPFALQNLQQRLSLFLAFQASDVYRVKGILWAEGYPRKIIVQSVNHDLAIGFGDSWAEDEIKDSRMVFIGRKLNPPGFEKMLRQCLFKQHIQI